MSGARNDDPRAEEGPDGEVLAVRFGRSANCSSVGSVVDVLFVSSVIGTALLGALAVAVRGSEPDTVDDEEDDGSGAGKDEDEDPSRPS